MQTCTNQPSKTCLVAFRKVVVVVEHTACLRIAERVAEQFGIASDRLIPQNKDWNDDLAEITEAQALAPVTQQMG